jgi:hypothetical protein
MYSLDLTGWNNKHLFLSRLTEHEACEKLFREIMKQLTVRSGEQKTSQEYARLSSAIRLRMKQYSSEVLQLKDKLSEASASHSMYPYDINKVQYFYFKVN